jgi:hypothetical protein
MKATCVALAGRESSTLTDAFGALMVFVLFGMVSVGVIGAGLMNMMG